MKEEWKFHKAQPEDLPMIQEMLIQTVQWLQSKGSIQWSGILEGKDNHNTPAAIERGEVFYGTVNEEPAGMLILWDQQSDWDKALWGEEPGNDFFYLHRLNVARKFAGQGISMKLIKSALKYAEEQNKKAVRLDCRSEIQNLNHLYQQAGFEFLETKKDFDSAEQTYDFNLYQFPLQ